MSKQKGSIKYVDKVCRDYNFWKVIFPEGYGNKEKVFSRIEILTP